MAKLEIWANMPVRDVDRARAFFMQLGFTPNDGHNSKNLASFKFSDGNFVIHFFREDLFNNSAGNHAGVVPAAPEIMFTIAAKSKEDVDQWCDNVILAGGTVFEGPHEIEWGYNFGFADLDGHRWNVFYCNPGMK